MRIVRAGLALALVGVTVCWYGAIIVGEYDIASPMALLGAVIAGTLFITSPPRRWLTHREVLEDIDRLERELHMGAYADTPDPDGEPEWQAAPGRVWDYSSGVIYPGLFPTSEPTE